MNYGMVCIFVYLTNIHDAIFNLFFWLEYRTDSGWILNGTDYIGLLIGATVWWRDVSK